MEKCPGCGAPIQNTICEFCGRFNGPDEPAVIESVATTYIFFIPLENDTAQTIDTFLQNNDKFKAAEYITKITGLDFTVALTWIDERLKNIDHSTPAPIPEAACTCKFLNMNRKYIESVLLVSTEQKRNGGGIATGAIIGAALLGPVGLLAGAAAPKHQQATYSIRFINNIIVNITAKEKSDLYNLLLELDQTK